MTGKSLAGSYLLALLCGAGVSMAQETFDRERVKALYEKSHSGAKLSEEDQKYLERGLQYFKIQPPGAPKPPTGGQPEPKREEKPSTGLKPLTEMTASERYKGEDGGLYGGGKNEPPPSHQAAADEALAKIQPLDAQGHPAADGKIVFISLGMSNTAGEFRMFKEIADADPAKSPKVQIVNCAVGGAGVSTWAKSRSGAWLKVDDFLKEAGVTPAQVQVAWIKHAEPAPQPDATELQYAHQVSKDIGASLVNARATFPNLRLEFLSSRIYGGYNTAGLRLTNPEPFAYETAFADRWLILDQIRSEQTAKIDGPVLLWGPYMWADGVTPRQSDGLTWLRADLSNDGVHPSPQGGAKVANMLLTFFKTNRWAKPWFAK